MTTPELKRSVIWLLLASFIGFFITAVFSMGLRWERSLFLIPYFVISGLFFAIYFLKQPISLKQLLGPWQMGLVGVAVAALFLLWKVQGHPTSTVPEGIQLGWAIIWIGIAYGVVDGLLLNVIPVLIVYRAWPDEAGTSRTKLLIRGFIALLASILVTIAYHLGYTEFHGISMLGVIIGNSIITLAYLLTGSPLSAIVTHVIMHIAAVLHGMETVLMLPPHYVI